MMRLVKDQLYRQQVVRFVSHMIPTYGLGFGNCATMAVIDDRKEELVAGIVFHNWSPMTGVIEMSIASKSPRWLTRGIVHDILSYPFDRADCQMIVTRSAPDNPATEIMRKLGAVQYEIARLRGRDQPETISCLYDDVFRAGKYGDRNGQAEVSDAA